MKGMRLRKSKIIAAVLTLCCAACAGITMLFSSAASVFPGDINLDTVVDVRDAVILARLVSNDTELETTEEERKNADVNLNGKVDNHDLIMLLNQLAGKLPMPHPLTETTTATTTTTTSTDTEITTSETTETTTTTTTVISEPEKPELSIDKESYPLEVSMSALTGTQIPDELLTVQYQDYNMTFAIYTNLNGKTIIGIAANDLLVGYYGIGIEYTAPRGYRVSEYIDKYSKGTGKLFAVLAMKEGYTISYEKMADKNNFTVMAKLNFYATNGLRALNGLPPFLWDEELAKVSANHSRDMAEHNFASHKGSDGKTPSDRMDDARIDWQMNAENIDYGYTDPFSAAEGWYTSETGHRDNLLSKQFTNLGVGIAYNADAKYRYYGTQDFYRGWD